MSWRKRWVILRDLSNHACVFNALVEESRVGNKRMLAMRAKSDVYAGEQCCIDYADEYLGKERWCCCGADECKGKENNL
ncbi:hypothetical protein FB567DRAFT_55634 [Paraphoma chrysanthemicola]|uniref:SET domain-containing protein n=1 Tax=Paraphoma chrysanthemicola TaxID=798071 RepID=A0A8K0R4J1_9PLEO|nr:hypothetical protein FB567DRAFT_55634 [Paraphoma chrysanthemicola]